MKITVNGEQVTLDVTTDELTIADFLEHMQITPKGIAIEHNFNIAPRSLHRQQYISDGDTIEIIQAVGGG